jgi:hypothetical protein
MVKEADRIVAMVIGENEDDVPRAHALDLLQLEAGLFLLAKSRGRQQGCQHSHQDQVAPGEVDQGTLPFISMDLE